MILRVGLRSVSWVGAIPTGLIVLSLSACGGDGEPARSFDRSDLPQLLRGNADSPTGTTLLTKQPLSIDDAASEALGVEKLRELGFVAGEFAVFEELPEDGSVGVASETVRLFEDADGAARYMDVLRENLEADVGEDPGRDEYADASGLGDDAVGLRDNGDPSEWYSWRVDNLVLSAGGDDRDRIDPKGFAEELHRRARALR